MSGLSSGRHEAAFKEMQRVLQNFKPDNLQSNTSIGKFKRKTNALLRQLEQATPQDGPRGPRRQRQEDGPHAYHPFFIKPGCVGYESARESVEAWYKALPRAPSHHLQGVPLPAAELIVSKDAFLVGLDLADVLRELHIQIDMSNAFVRGYARDLPRAVKWRQSLDEIRRIKQRPGFELTIILTQKHIRLNVWPEFLEALQPLVMEFKMEGAQVKFTFRELDLPPLVTKPVSEWRQEAATFFDTQTPRLRTWHQAYLAENNPDYDPNDASHTDGEDKQPGDDLSPPQEEAGHESVYSDMNDEPQIKGTLLINCGSMDQDYLDPMDRIADIQSDLKELQKLIAAAVKSGDLKM
ncbi:hypothetical protein PTTW11_05687 [Pyrenophora teres f. teres]|nr:hypothetical protein PTTW11_05687 [Pyrenophora teres f. teres]